ncbi:MAG: hypothetical protein IMZ53_00855 [Thermoplasmata archaeon]|nr:hypothetical protein [Thermoplasmata archaeon]
METKEKKITSEKPVSLYPLDFKEAVAAFLKVKPKPKEEKTEEKKEGNPSD